MSLQRMTAGERRGLILLILLLLIATLLLTWRDNVSASHTGSRPESSADTVSSDRQTADSETSSALADTVLSLPVADSAAVGHKRRHRSDSHRRKAPSRKAIPPTRSPRDERVD